MVRLPTLDRTETFVRGSVGEDYFSRAMTVIPGVTQLLSKRPDQFGLDIWPTYYRRAKRSYVWDLDGVKYLDMSISGIGANILGYRDRDVDRKVRRVISRGNSTSLNCPEEVELAELLVELHPWADAVRFVRTGGEAMAVAVRIARASTGREKILFCGYHGWHDWYLSANLGSSDSLGGHLLPGLDPVGVPSGLAGSSIPFQYNDFEELKSLASSANGEIAAIVMEPVRSTEPAIGFLESVRKLATEIGAVLIFDEISSGFRYEVGGYHLRTAVDPDIAVFAKAMSNGYAMAAIVGSSGVMQAVTSSFVSSTYWTERIGPAAAIATITKLRNRQVVGRLRELGVRIQEIWKDASQEFGIPVAISGFPAMSYLAFLGAEALDLQTLFTREMLARGVLAGPRYYANYAQTDRDVEKYEAATFDSFSQIKQAILDGNLSRRVGENPAQPGFGRLN